MSSSNVWKPELYDHKLGMVAELGKGVVELLNPQKGETILDLGCGTGHLTKEIADLGAQVIGMDYSQPMIESASKQYPEIRFFVGDAEQFTVEERFDAVFSNAALHWMNRPERVVSCVWDALKPDGRFVAEFGGQSNVETVLNAMVQVLTQQFGIDASARNPWYFPSIGEYSKVLEHQGFRVTYALHFDRPTRMKDGELGINHWLASFGGDFFKGLSEADIAEACGKIAEMIKPRLFYDGAWHIDYKRLRIVAVKPGEA
ncbi:class I SAM-dependent methyltransferase [Paenibacillus thalictri]|uniref:Class I SAM-dependent methyltransferase n=1 Tax=Paenibacillus thalictri TaxID=2527873 RepID=A0A4Q9DMS7_9BACL|nr:class I SAM-dependent methyltransferase [Paenibacillus thalictri]TBL75117.1 class I SAM-dependent methyltransferase [Paenibacillus thalictri]